MIHPEPPSTWYPTSPCDAACVPPVTAGGTLRLLRRLAALLPVFAAVALTAPLLRLVPERGRTAWLRTVTRTLLAAAGVHVRIVGPTRFGDAGVLVVANHMSWVEVLALSAVQPVRLVAKSEVRDWPGIGAVAEALGVIFVDRARLHALPGSVDRIGQALAAGHPVAVFPEGTTWCGTAAGAFRRAPFQAVVDTGAPVRPVAVVLRAPDGPSTPAASFVGEETLVTCLLRVLRMPGLVCELTVLPLIAADGDRAALARRAAAAIGDVTGVPHRPLRERRREPRREGLRGAA